MSFALDSWAVLRLLEGTEPAAGRVEQVLAEDRPVMNWINLGEVFYIVRRDQPTTRPTRSSATYACVSTSIFHPSTGS